MPGGLVVNRDNRYNSRPTHHAPCQMAAKRGATRSRSIRAEGDERWLREA